MTGKDLTDYCWDGALAVAIVMIVVAIFAGVRLAKAETVSVTVTAPSQQITVQPATTVVTPETVTVNAVVSVTGTETVEIAVPGPQGIPGATTSGEGGGGTWGSIIGTLSDQADLQSALDNKAAISHGHTGTYEPANSNIQGHIVAVGNPHATAATDISYSNPTYTTVGAALDQLLYVAPGSPSVSGGGTYETGQTIASVVLNWTIALGNKTLTSQSIDNGIGSISTALRTYTHSGQSITSNRTYTVSISDGTTPRTGTTTVSFSRYRHWGASTIPLASFTSANILALASSEFSTSHSKSVTYDCTGGRYPTFAFVATAGTLTATTVGGLAFSDYSYRTISHTNASGSTTNYYVYQFNNIQTGAAVAVVWD